MPLVRVIGGGPAGSCAALAALAEGAQVEVFEISAFPRHKVCGEFLSPEAAAWLDATGAAEAFHRLGPARLERVCLHFGARQKSWRLAEPAFGISRFALDHFLQQLTLARGARWIREKAGGQPPPVVIAHGRKLAAEKGSRRFGFKAHFAGPAGTDVDLFFFDGCYLGVSAVESGHVNVCGLAPEDRLRRFGFQIDEFLEAQAGVCERLRPLRRIMPWLTTGPLLFTRRLPDSAPGQYLCGDALGFIDPFTGSGLLSAMGTGQLAGRAAARGEPVHVHLRRCRQALAGQYRFSAAARGAIESGWAGLLAFLIPGPALFGLTRPRFV